MIKEEIKVAKVLKAALKGGLVAAGVNIAWLYVLEFTIGLKDLPQGFPVAVVISSILPIFLGGLLYAYLAKNLQKGRLLFLIISIGFAVLSIFPSFQTTMADGNPAPHNFAVLTVPMHFFATLIGLYFIIKKSN
ncbi:MAG: hypothetical protein CFE21_14210 [Bacteroidetes bacterium B1(2017)]|nr:MAG: hypothetical protein CFE21_14210 [Bacteroidetes bacterium B1(2017)]